MKAVDTNVLARLFVRDDPTQHELALTFFAARTADDPAYVSLVVLAEFVWLLDRTYNYPKKQIAEALAGLLESPDFVIEGRSHVEAAVFLSKRPKVGITDVLIASLAREARCEATFTFDKPAAKRVPGMELLA